jgi:hypothetical protein
VIAADQHVGDKGRWKDIALRLEQLLASSSERDLPIGSEKNEMRRIFLPFAAIVSMTVSAFGAPDERILGKKAGYPIGTTSNWFYDEHVQVGSFSNLDKIEPNFRTSTAVRLA